MGIFSDGLDQAYLASKNEKQRQGIINAGLDQINAIFGGGTVPFWTPQTQTYNLSDWKGGGNQSVFYRLGKKGEFKPYYAPKQPSDLSKFASNMFGGGLVDLTGQSLIDQLSNKNWLRAFKNKDILGIATGGLFGLGPDKKTKRQLVNEQIKQNNLFTANNQTFEGFQPSFYKEREKAYTDYAMPELASQYRNNRDAILYGLANRGLLGGSVQSRASSDLERTSGKARQSITDSAIAQAQELKRSVEQARQDAIRQLYTASKPSEAISSAISTAGGFRTPSSFAPIGDLFTNLLRQYYTSQVLQNQRSGGGYYTGASDYSLPSAPISY